MTASYLFATGEKDFIDAPSDRRFMVVGEEAPIVLKNVRLSFPNHARVPTKPATFCNGKFSVTGTLKCKFEGKKVLRQFQRAAKRQRAEYGWFNWYVNRGRMTLSRDPRVIEREMRSKSWRRAL